jgi:hypothetical protein
MHMVEWPAVLCAYLCVRWGVCTPHHVAQGGAYLVGAHQCTEHSDQQQGRPSTQQLPQRRCLAGPEALHHRQDDRHLEPQGLRPGLHSTEEAAASAAGEAPAGARESRASCSLERDSGQRTAQRRAPSPLLLGKPPTDACCTQYKMRDLNHCSN